METKRPKKKAKTMGLNQKENVKSSVVWKVTPCSWVEVHTDVSKEHTFCIFRVEE
jgi:hypothetical protein